MRRSGFSHWGLGAIAVVVAAGATARAEVIYGITGATSGASAATGLVQFDSASPGTVNNIGTFGTGLVAGHTIRSIDFRPLTGELWAISADAANVNVQLYTVGLGTANLTPVGAGFALTGNTSPFIEMDFNPAVDRIRILTGNQTAAGANNWRANPLTGGLVQQDGNLAYDAGDPQAGNQFIQVFAAAYSNNVAGAGATTLYAWDWQTDSLSTIGGPNGTPSPNLGTMFTVNNPGTFLTTNPGVGMDISGLSNTLYVTKDSAASTAMGLYTRDLTSGAVALIGNYPGGTNIIDISVQPIPEPTSMALCGLGVAGFAARTWRKRKA